MGSCFCLLLCYVLWKGQINERVGGKYYARPTRRKEEFVQPRQALKYMYILRSC